MTTTAEAAPTSDRELVLTRIIDAPRAKVFRAWTDPELLKQWFAPLPYTTPVAELDVRPGGANFIVMRDPQGNDLRTAASISKWCRTSASSLPTPIPRLGSLHPSRS
jgi:uncharacterized protein YndB with AHSA1/START domain